MNEIHLDLEGLCSAVLLIVLQTRGYENWQGGEANLLITRGMVGRLSNTPNVGFAYEIQGVTEYLTSRGVRAIPGERISTEELRGLYFTRETHSIVNYSNVMS